MQNRKRDRAYDTIILGAGPAGLTAAIYLGRFNRRSLVLHAGDSRAHHIPLIRNLPGFPNGISGPDLLKSMTRHAESYGAEVRHCEVETVAAQSDGWLARGFSEQATAPTLLIATGVVDLGPPISGLPEAAERGVFRICPICDGYETIGKQVAIVGEADRCLAEAHFVRQLGANVSILGAGLDVLRQRVARLNGIDVHEDVIDIDLLDDLVRVTLSDGRALDFDHIYSAYGCVPRTELLSDLKTETNEEGYLVADAHQRLAPKGLWVAGDVVASLSQISVACGQGAIAAANIHNTLSARNRYRGSG